MSDQSFREIQLSGKQLVFLFMTSVVVVVAVFLLGVSVGRGVRANGGVLDVADEASLVGPPADLPPPTEMTPDDVDFHAALQGTPTPPAEPVPEVLDLPDEGGAAAESSDEPPVTAVVPPTFPDDNTDRAEPAAAPPARAVAQGWFVQVGAYQSRANADRQAAELVAKGYAATVAAPAAAGGLYRVRIGPVEQRAEAEQTRARLVAEEGMKPSVTR